jgi:hypothetical protein
MLVVRDQPAAGVAGSNTYKQAGSICMKPDRGMLNNPNPGTGRLWLGTTVQNRCRYLLLLTPLPIKGHIVVLNSKIAPW